MHIVYSSVKVDDCQLLLSLPSDLFLLTGKKHLPTLCKTTNGPIGRMQCSERPSKCVFSESSGTQCLPNPCKNGGSCSVDNGAVRCNCPSTASGTYCEAVSTGKWSLGNLLFKTQFPLMWRPLLAEICTKVLGLALWGLCTWGRGGGSRSLMSTF